MPASASPGSGSDDSDGLGLGDDDLDEWVGTPKKPVATGAKKTVEKPKRVTFLVNIWVNAKPYTAKLLPNRTNERSDSAEPRWAKSNNAMLQ